MGNRLWWSLEIEDYGRISQKELSDTWEIIKGSASETWWKLSKGKA